MVNCSGYMALVAQLLLQTGAASASRLLPYVCSSSDQAAQFFRPEINIIEQPGYLDVHDACICRDCQAGANPRAVLCTASRTGR
jgi:hypothetical protein